MASSVSAIATVVAAAVATATVAGHAGVSAGDWASVVRPRIFRGLAGYLGGRNRGRLPFLEYEIEGQQFAHEHQSGGTETSTIRLRVHTGSASDAVSGNLTAAVLAACLASIRSVAVNNYMALGNDDIQSLAQGPWGYQRDAVLTVEHTFDRSTYEVT